MTDVENNTFAIPRSVETQLEAIFKRDASANNIAIVWPQVIDRAEMQTTFSIGTINTIVVCCVSELAIRYELLKERPVDTRLVMLVAADNSNLAEDVRARLWRQQVRRIDAWQTLIERLELRAIDPRLTKMGKNWFADALLQVWPQIEGETNIGDVLDHDSAWLALARGWLGFTAAQLDADTLFAWSIDLQPVKQPPDGFLQHIDHWFAPRLGDMAPVAVAALRNGTTSAENGATSSITESAGSFLALGLVIDLLASDSSATDNARTLVTLEERYLNRVQPDQSALRAFGQAARRFTQRMLSQSGSTPSAKIVRTLQTAENLLQELGCAELAFHSDLLPNGYQLRVDNLAQALSAHLSGSQPQNWQDVESGLAHIDTHFLADDTTQKQRVHVPVALARWLRRDAPSFSELTRATDLVRAYKDDGGFVDFARARLWNGDTNTNLADAYELLLAEVGQHLHSANQHFADDIEGLARGDKLPADLVYVENAIDELVAPLVKQQPVLLLVMDGMSQAVWRELADSFFLPRWAEYQRTGQKPDNTDSTRACSLIAAFPSVTKVCRHALFTGTLSEGAAADESRGFAKHPALMQLTGKTTPPVIFHKDKLREPGRPGLSSQVRRVVADEKHRLVSVVVNVVDDQLSSNDQLISRWREESLPVVDQVLDAAREAGRLVVLTSDHGHVRAFDSTRGDHGNDAQDGRYKAGTASVDEGEVLITGERVVQTDNKIVAPWSEHIRYAHPKKGYHGGVSLQEMVIPFAVYGISGQEPELDGWSTVTQHTPDWWQATDLVTPHILESREYSLEIPIPRKGSSPKTQLPMGDLFEDLEPKTEAPSATDDWVTSLLQSQTLASQRKRNARIPIDDTTLQLILSCLRDRGYQATTSEIARATGKPQGRVKGLMAGARKLLNVDGYDILSEDQPSDTVRLNRQQLFTQFGLEEIE